MIIENFNELAVTPLRKQALLIADAGLRAAAVNKVEAPLSSISGELVWVQGNNTIIEALLAAGATTGEIHTIIKHLPNLASFGKLVLIVNETKIIPETTMYEAAEILQRYKVLETTVLLSAELVTASTESHHIQIISLEKTVSAMKQKAEDLGWPVYIWSKTNSGEASSLGETIMKNAKAGSCMIGLGQQRQNQTTLLEALPYIAENQVFLAVGSGVFDNSDAAGAIVDTQTLVIAQKLYLDPELYLANNDSYHFLEETCDLIFTGPGTTNVSGFFVCLRQ